MVRPAIVVDPVRLIHIGIVVVTIGEVIVASLTTHHSPLLIDLISKSLSFGLTVFTFVPY